MKDPGLRRARMKDPPAADPAEGLENDRLVLAARRDRNGPADNKNDRRVPGVRNDRRVRVVRNDRSDLAARRDPCPPSRR